MLILTRRFGESLIIDGEITVTVLGARRGQVRLGIAAPRSVAVHREEIYERLQNDTKPSPQSDENRMKSQSDHSCFADIDKRSSE